jgi:hypothetical protein
MQLSKKHAQESPSKTGTADHVSCKSVKTPFSSVPSQDLDFSQQSCLGFALATLTFAQNRLNLDVPKRRLRVSTCRLAQMRSRLGAVAIAICLTDAKLVDWNGNTVTLESLKRKPLAVDFSYTLCPRPVRERHVFPMKQSPHCNEHSLCMRLLYRRNRSTKSPIKGGRGGAEEA